MAMASAGIVTGDPIIADGIRHRFHVEGDRPGKKNGWCVLHSSPYPRGVFGSWKLGIQGTWKGELPKGLSKDEREAAKKQIAEREAEWRAEEEEQEADARARAQSIWGRATAAPDDHPYLRKKQISPHGVRLYKGCLVVPVKDAAGNLSSLQFITPSGEKRFLRGGRIAGCCFDLGEIRKYMYIVEGFATGATVHEVTGDAVAVAFDAGNLKAVAEALHRKYPAIQLVIAADDDAWTPGNPGRAKALEAGKALKCKVALPEFPRTRTHPTDFNDLCRLEGAVAVKEQLLRARRAEMWERIPGVRAADVKPQKVSWLWTGWIPRGEITMLDGDPGMGKSAITLDLAARVTKGWGMPDGSDAQMGPRGVVIISTEDTPSTTIRPRLEAAGADLTRVRIITEITDTTGAVYSPEFGNHEREIEAAIFDVDAALLIIDPLMVSLDAKTDTHKDAEVRRNLTVLKRLAQRTGISAVGLRHFNKAGGSSPLYRGQGSIAFSGAARAVLVAARDPENQGQRVLAVAKSNLAAQPPSLRYSLGSLGETVRVAWEGESPRTAVDLLANMETEEFQSARADAKEFLRLLLAYGPIPSEEVIAKGKKQGFSERTLRRAKKDLNVKARLVGQGRDGKWRWELPESAKEPPEAATLAELAASDQITGPSDVRSTIPPEAANSESLAASDPQLAASNPSQQAVSPQDSGVPTHLKPAPASPQAREERL